MAKETILTKEYFDKVIGAFSKSVDRRFKEQNKELKDHVSKELSREIGGLAGMVQRQFTANAVEMSKLNAKVDRIEHNTSIKIVDHKNRIRRTEKALGIDFAL